MLSAKVDIEQRKIDARMQSCNREKTEQQPFYLANFLSIIRVSPTSSVSITDISPFYLCIIISSFHYK